MTTARTIVDRALRKARIVAHGEDSPAENASAALEDLNMMLAGWNLSGVDIGFTAMDMADTFPLAAEYEEGTVHMLAGRIAPDYGFPIGFDPDDFFRKIQAAYMVIATVTMPKAVTELPSTAARSGTLAVE